MAKAYLQKATITILGNTWHIFYCSTEQYKKLASERGDDSRACTLPRKKKIIFNCDRIWAGDQVANHELMHAYISELNGHDVPMDRETFEEFICVMMERYVLQLLKKAKPITKKLMSIRKQLKLPPPEEEEYED